MEERGIEGTGRSKGGAVVAGETGACWRGTTRDQGPEVLTHENKPVLCARQSSSRTHITLFPGGAGVWMSAGGEG